MKIKLLAIVLAIIFSFPIQSITVNASELEFEQDTESLNDETQQSESEEQAEEKFEKTILDESKVNQNKEQIEEEQILDNIIEEKIINNKLNENLNNAITIIEPEMVNNPYPAWQTINGITTRPCTWYAWKVANERMGADLRGLGNGGQWYDNARNRGYRVGTTAEANSIAVWQDGSYGHVGYVESVNGNTMYVLEGGRMDLPGTEGIGTISLSNVVGTYRPWNQKLIGFIYLNNDKTAPTISNVRVTDVNGDGYTVTCTISDNVGVTRVMFPSWNTDIHIGDNADWLVGTISGNTASVRVSIASLKSGNREGNYVTHIYAYDAAGNSTSAGTPITYIDRTPPVISNVQVKSKDSTGYTVTCNVSDNRGISKVQFPTWTTYNGQDDLAPNWNTNAIVKGTLSGNTATFRVKISEHNNEKGTYVTHIYAFDTCGNSAKAVVPDVVITSTSSNNSKLDNFVKRLYKNVLGRTAKSSEIKYYTDQLTAKKTTGVEVGKSFVFSQEFKNKKSSNSAYIDVLYQTFMGRTADKAGKTYWKKMLDNGVSREYIFKGFVESAEFTGICKTYGITRGNVKLTEARDQNANLTMFISRCYQKALGRNADVSGLNYYTKEIQAKKITPLQASKNFVFSSEFKNKKLSNTEYVKVLYRTFLGREFDKSGLNYHLSRIKNGTSREKILSDFSNSLEFKKVIKSFGL